MMVHNLFSVYNEKMNYRKNGQKNKTGFSLIEVLISLFVFSVLVAVISGVYVGFLAANSNAKATQKNLEGAQAVFNGLSKNLRTGKVIVPQTQPANPVSTIRIYDYSQAPSGSACMEYSIAGEKLLLRASAAVFIDEDGCTPATDLGSAVSLIDGRVFGGFIVKLSDASNAGKVTASFQLCPKGSSSSSCGVNVGNPIRIQSSISLRIR